MFRVLGYAAFIGTPPTPPAPSKALGNGLDEGLCQGLA
jgi:hypothetical protein